MKNVRLEGSFKVRGETFKDMCCNFFLNIETGRCLERAARYSSEIDILVAFKLLYRHVAMQRIQDVHHVQAEEISLMASCSAWMMWANASVPVLHTSVFYVQQLLSTTLNPSIHITSIADH